MTINNISPKISKITIENFGGNGYIALKETENMGFNSCMITQKVDTPFSGSLMDSNTINYSLDDNFTTKFYIVSISALGLYIFYKMLLK
jgi:hypothetical protein